MRRDDMGSGNSAPSASCRHQGGVGDSPTPGGPQWDTEDASEPALNLRSGSGWSGTEVDVALVLGIAGDVRLGGVEVARGQVLELLGDFQQSVRVHALGQL